MNANQIPPIVIVTRHARTLTAAILVRASRDSGAMDTTAKVRLVWFYIERLGAIVVEQNMKSTISQNW